MHLNQSILSSCSIRMKLLLLLLLIFLPIAGLVVASGLAHRRVEITRANESALLLAQSLAAQQEQIASGTRQMLSTMALLPDVKNMDTEACNQLFKELNDQYPSYSIISAASPDGNVFAASVPFKAGSVNLSDRKHIKDVIRTHAFSVGEYSVGKVSGVQSINYTYPVLDKNQKLIGIVIASFKLDEFAGFIRKVKLPEGSAVTISDHLGVRLYRYPESEAVLPGKQLPEEVVKQMSGDLGQGIFEKTGQDGIERIYAFRQLYLHDNAHPYLFVSVGVPKTEIVRKANQEMFRSLSALGALALIMMSLAWGFGQVVFVKPINQLVIATRRLMDGESNARTGLRHTSDELGRLANSFDNMASILDQRNIERENTENLLRKAEEKYRNIFENAVVGIFTSTPDGRFIEVNQAMARILGYASPEEMKDAVRNTCRQVYVNPAKGQECIWTIIDQGKSIFEIEVFKRDGSRRWVSNHMGMVRDDRGEISHFEGVVEDITLRRQAEEKLREYEKVVEGLEEMIAVVDKDYRYLIANRSLLNYLNLEREQVVGNLVSEIVGNEKFEAVVKEKLDMCFQGNIVKYEIRYECPVVGERDLLITYLPIEGHTDVDRVASIVQDITGKKITQKELERYRKFLEDIVKERTLELEKANIELQHEVNERKRIEIQLRESETKYRTLVEQIPAITYMETIGDRPDILYVSPQVESMLGFTMEESIADRKLKSKILHPDDRERVISQLKKLKEEGASFTSEYRMIDRNGKEKWFLDKARVVCDSLGKPDFLHGVMLDISEKKHIEEALRYSENFYRTMFESTGTAMVIVEEDTTISLANAQYEKYAGHPRNEIEGKKSWTDIIHKDDLERLKTYHTLRRIHPDLAPKQYESQIIDKLGGTRYVIINIAMIPNTRKSVASLLDITDRKIAERELEQSVAELNNLQNITRKFLQLEALPTVLNSIAEGIVVNIGYDVAIVAKYQKKDRILSGFVVHPAHLENIMDYCWVEKPKGTIWERKLKCMNGQNADLDRILKGETVIDGSLFTFISQWISSPNARQIQELAGRKGYICLPMRVKDETVGLILAGWNEKGKDLGRMRNALGRMADQAAMAVRSADLFNCITTQGKELRSLTVKLQRVQEAERKKIAQELHDRVGQNLTGLSIDFGIIRNLLPPEETKKVDSILVDCAGLVGNTMECIRDVMAELHPPGLTDYGLSSALKFYCDQLSRRTGLKVSVVSVGAKKSDFLSAPENEIALFRITQEAITNAVRHSKASEVSVSLNANAAELVLCIADNGVGFDMDDQIYPVDGGRFGLINMRERAEAVGGEFRVESAPGKGTKVIVEFKKGTP